MKITVVGTGYVGLVQSACMADLGNDVVGVDIDESKVQKLSNGESPIYEPGIGDVLKRNLKAKRLTFTTSLDQAVAKGFSEVIFIAVGTPSDDEGRADLQYVETVAHSIGKALDNHRAKLKDTPIIVNKSTVPIGTGDLVENIIREHFDGDFAVVSNPEFLREGSALGDFMEPDRVVIGSNKTNEIAKRTMNKLYAPLKCPILHTDVKTAELIKYASNSMLATQISFINSIARISEKVGADVTLVAEGMKFDKRIGKHAFLNAGVGYGGSCFPKDVKALVSIAKDAGADFKILEEVEMVNWAQRESLVSKAEDLVGNLKNKTIAVWGLAFKPKTDDMREAPVVSVIEMLQKKGAKIVAFDPVAQHEANKYLKNVDYGQSPLAAVKNADALVIMTEWDEFRQLDLHELKLSMKTPNIVDGRNMYDLEEMAKLGFNYVSVGRPLILQKSNKMQETRTKQGSIIK